MSNFPTFKKSSELDPAGTLTKAEIIEIVQDGLPKRTTIGDIVKIKKDVQDVLTGTGNALAGDTRQVTVIDNSASTAKTVTITGAPAGRAMTFVIVVNGGAGAFTWPAGVVWDKNTQPKLGTTRTIVVIFWDGTNFTGNQGATA